MAAAMYATVEDLIARSGERELIGLTDRADPPTGTIDRAIVEAALAAASAEIDGYIAARYRVPLDPAPLPIRTATVALARHALWTTDRPEAVRQDRDDATRLLRDIANGIAALAAPVAGTPTPTTASAGVRASGGPPLITRDRLSGAGGYL